MNQGSLSSENDTATTQTHASTDGFSDYVEDTIDLSPYPLLLVIVLYLLSCALLYLLSRNHKHKQQANIEEIDLEEQRHQSGDYEKAPSDAEEEEDLKELRFIPPIATIATLGPTLLKNSQIITTTQDDRRKSRKSNTDLPDWWKGLSRPEEYDDFALTMFRFQEGKKSLLDSDEEEITFEEEALSLVEAQDKLTENDEESSSEDASTELESGAATKGCEALHDAETKKWKGLSRPEEYDQFALSMFRFQEGKKSLLDSDEEEIIFEEEKQTLVEVEDKSSENDEESSREDVSTELESGATAKGCEALCGDETKKICKLALPLVTAAIIQGIAEIARVVIIGHYVGTPELSAYVVVDTFVRITTDFLRGFHQSLITLCSHSIGTNNDKLTGQYVQIVVVLYTVMSIPVGIFWIATIGTLLSWLGFDQHIVELAESFIVYLVIARLLEGIAKGFDSLLDVSGYEVFSTVYTISFEVATSLVLFIWALLSENPSLDVVGIILVICYFAGAAILTLIVAFTGWLQDYFEGLFRTCALSNWEAVKMVLRTSTPIAFGYLLTYGEWEILTVFASFLGPAEVAAWSILGVLWDALEQVTEAAADASEIRCAYLLGAGEPSAAKASASKSIRVGFVIAVILSSSVLIFREGLVQALTTDPTLRGMLQELIPIVAAGNIALSTGVMAWTLLGSQGRYQLATKVGFGGTVLLSLPLSAVVTIALRINLEGQAAACAIGYIFSGTINFYFLLTSSWEDLSLKVIKHNAENDVILESTSCGSAPKEENKNSRTESLQQVWEIWV